MKTLFMMSRISWFWVSVVVVLLIVASPTLLCCGGDVSWYVRRWRCMAWVASMASEVVINGGGEDRQCRSNEMKGVGGRNGSLNLKMGGLVFGWGYACFIREYRSSTPK
ncbi:hypothetical protein Tco_1317012 [Tanacetum coccineum]